MRTHLALLCREVQGRPPRNKKQLLRHVPPETNTVGMWRGHSHRAFNVKIGSMRPSALRVVQHLLPLCPFGECCGKPKEVVLTFIIRQNKRHESRWGILGRGHAHFFFFYGQCSRTWGESNVHAHTWSKLTQWGRRSVVIFCQVVSREQITFKV